MRQVIALLAGALFGAGLVIGGMTDPLKVQAFLDLAGQWDPTLAFVMGGGLLVTVPGFWLLRRRSAPLFESRFYLPTRKDLDARLMGGAACFGIGWGIAGFCPGPAVASLVRLDTSILIFVAAMLAGMALADRLPSAPTPPSAP